MHRQHVIQITNASAVLRAARLAVNMPILDDADKTVRLHNRGNPILAGRQRMLSQRMAKACVR